LFNLTMQRRTVIYIQGHHGQTGTNLELCQVLGRAVEHRGDLVVGTFANQGAEGRRRAGWKALIASLDGVDLLAVASAADLPGRTVQDLLRHLETLRNHGVDLFLLAEGIDSATAPAVAMLDLISAYRRANLPVAIKTGQAMALEAGKRVGRPEVPQCVRRRIQAALLGGAGIRPTARRFNVSGATVINIRATMTRIDAEALSLAEAVRAHLPMVFKPNAEKMVALEIVDRADGALISSHPLRGA
jgi:DNA invertase Pin-like site-specific DNA recombinase